MEAQQAHEGEMKTIFAAERERIEDECKKLRQQLVLATAEVIHLHIILIVCMYVWMYGLLVSVPPSIEQTCRERERAAARSIEDRERSDKLQQEFAQESSANKAQMQQQIVKILQDTQV